MTDIVSRKITKKQNRVFNCDMVLYYLRNYMSYGCAPKQMIDPNTKTDYSKMNKLLRFDKLDGNRKGIIKSIAETEQVITSLEESFPARALTNPDTFTSLLFYYGMLTIKGTHGMQLVLGIPNNNVRKQYYGYLLEEYQQMSRVSLNDLIDKFTNMAFDGDWRTALSSMAQAYANISSVRDGIEAERNLQGFFMAYFSLNDYYYTAPELELNHGYCDFFLLPDLTHYPTQHSYIIELKCCIREIARNLLKSSGTRPSVKSTATLQHQELRPCAKAQNYIKSSCNLKASNSNAWKKLLTNNQTHTHHEPKTHHSHPAPHALPHWHGSTEHHYTPQAETGCDET